MYLVALEANEAQRAHVPEVVRQLRQLVGHEVEGGKGGEAAARLAGHCGQAIGLEKRSCCKKSYYAVKGTTSPLNVTDASG